MKKIVVLLLALSMALSLAPAMAEEPTPISIYLQMPAEFVAEGNPFVEQIENVCNVKIQWVMPPVNSYVESLNLMIADGNWPDIIQMPSTTSPAYINAVESEILIPLDDLIGNYENLCQYVDPSSYAALRASSGGTLYGVARNTILRQDGFIVRKDWCDKLGIALPEDGLMTLDEFYNMLYAFTYNDPDGDGVDNTYGISENCNSGDLFPLITYAFGIRGWQAHEGTYPYMEEEYCLEHDNYQKALAYTAKLWADGLIDPLWPNSLGNAFRERFYTGYAGCARFFGGWIATYENGLKANFPDAEVAYIAGIKDENGECKADPGFGGNIYSFYTLTLSCEGREDAALRTLDYLLSDEGWDLMNYGVKGLHWDEDENGNVYATDRFSEYEKYRSYLTLLRRYNDPDYFVGINLTPDQKAFAKAAIEKAVSITMPSLSNGYTPASSQETALLEYKSELSVVRSKIIMGELPVEAWHDAMEKYYEKGYSRVVDDMIAYIQDNQ